MGPKEQGLRDRYAALCAELGDVVTKVRLASNRQAQIEREIDGLDAAIPGAKQADAATPMEAEPTP